MCRWASTLFHLVKFFTILQQNFFWFLLPLSTISPCFHLPVVIHISLGAAVYLLSVCVLSLCASKLTDLCSQEYQFSFVFDLSIFRRLFHSLDFLSFICFLCVFVHVLIYVIKSIVKAVQFFIFIFIIFKKNVITFLVTFLFIMLYINGITFKCMVIKTLDSFFMYYKEYHISRKVNILIKYKIQ